MVDRTICDWVEHDFIGGLIGDRQVQMIRIQVSVILCKWWLMTVVTVEAVTTWLMTENPWYSVEGNVLHRGAAVAKWIERCTCNSRLWVRISALVEIQQLSTAGVRSLSKAPNPRLLPGRRSVGCPLLQVCVHLDGLNAENTFHCWLYSV